jgi:hypothetical protein
MAPQVRPGSTKPERPFGPQQSLEQMRSRPAHSIMAREFVSHTQAECKAAISTRDPEPKISLGMQGRPCKGLDASCPPRCFTRDAQFHTCWGTSFEWLLLVGGSVRRIKALLPLCLDSSYAPSQALDQPIKITGRAYFAVAIDASQPPPSASINATLACNREESTCNAVSSALNRVVWAVMTLL